MQTPILRKLTSLYGLEKGKEIALKLEEAINETKSKFACEDRPFWDEKDVFLIAYPDSFREIDSGQVFRQAQDTEQSRSARMTKTKTLKTLKKFLDKHLEGAISGLHILPFFPYSSDRGFSVVDYYKVKEEFGSWENIAEIAKNHRLMADIVLNHVSTKSQWFQEFLRGNEKYWNYFIHFEKDKVPHEALKKVSRPRPTPLLTPFKTARGERWLWTTFSVENFTDQVDLNYQNPEVLIELINILVNHLKNGVRIFRLDAVAYIWKEIGTTCKHLPQVHTIVSLMRDILDKLCPSAIIITETNAPYEENISYFGDGLHEAQMIYNFSLPALVLNAFYSGSSQHLTDWAKILSPPSDRCTYFNFLDTHDGVGVIGAKGILSDQEIKKIFERVDKHGGKLSYRKLPDGSEALYEMNTTWWSALNGSEAEPFELQLRKFITSRAISFALKGVPAVYYLSLFGQKNDLKLFQKTGVKRDINRTNFSYQFIDKNLTTCLKSVSSYERHSGKRVKRARPESNNDSGVASLPRMTNDILLFKQALRNTRIFNSMVSLIERRKKIKSFHPNARQDVLFLDSRVFALLRGEKEDRVLALHNVSKEKVEIKYQGKAFILEPYGFIWQEL